jgi:CRP-like cAMP-binding protein
LGIAAMNLYSNATTTPATQSGAGGNNAVVRRYASGRRLLERERELLQGLNAIAVPLGVGVAPAKVAKTPFFVLSGWLCRARSDLEGKRAIVEFLLPGDLVWPSSPTCRLGLTVEVLSNSVVASAASVLDANRNEPPNFAELSDPQAGADLARKYLLKQVVRLGRFNASTSLLTLIAELHERLRDVGLAGPNGFVCPLTQQVFSDAMGLSVVHVNRSFKALRSAGLVTRVKSHITLSATMAQISDACSNGASLVDEFAAYPELV